MDLKNVSKTTEIKQFITDEYLNLYMYFKLRDLNAGSITK